MVNTTISFSYVIVNLFFLYREVMDDGELLDIFIRMRVAYIGYYIVYILTIVLATNSTMHEVGRKATCIWQSSVRIIPIRRVVRNKYIRSYPDRGLYLKVRVYSVGLRHPSNEFIPLSRMRRIYESICRTNLVESLRCPQIRIQLFLSVQSSDLGI